MKLRKLNDIFEYQEKQLKRVRLKTDPKFDKLPYEGYVLSEQQPTGQVVQGDADLNKQQSQNKPPGTSIKSKVGGFLQKVGKGYESLQRGSEQARALGKGDLSVLKNWGNALLAKILDQDTNKAGQFGKKNFTNLQITDPSVIGKIAGDVNKPLSFKIGKKENLGEKGYSYVLTPSDIDTKNSLVQKNLAYAKFVKKDNEDISLNSGDLYFYNTKNAYEPEYTTNGLNFTYKSPNYIMGRDIQGVESANPDSNMPISKTSDGLLITPRDNNVIEITVKNPDKLTEEEKAVFGNPNIAGYRANRAVKSNGKPHDIEKQAGIYMLQKKSIKPFTK